MEDDLGFTAEELVQACNKILVYAGLIARVGSVEEVKIVCSSTSVLVAALEGFLQQRLDDVIRAPSTPEERAFNNNLVVDVLSQILGTDLSHISGERIVEGSLEDISNLLELLAALCNGMPLQGPAPAGDSGGDDAGTEADPAAADGIEGSPAAAEARSAPGGSAEGHPDVAADSPDREDDNETGEEEQDASSDASSGAPRSWHVRYPDEDEEPEASSDGAVQSGSEASGYPDVGRRQRSRAMRQLALSPIQEASREGADGLRASRERSNAQGAKAGATRSRLSRGGGAARGSNGGASSVISIPSDVGGETSQRSTGGDSSGRSSNRHDAPRRAWSVGESEPQGTDESAMSPASASTTALLERALSEAEATLRELGHEYEDFFHKDDKGRRASLVSRQRKGTRRKAGGSSVGAGSRSSSGNTAFKAARRSLRAGPWPDGGTGTVEQHKTFLRRAKRVLAGATGGESGSEAPSRSSRGQGKSSDGSFRGLGRQTAGQRGLVPLPGAQPRAAGRSRRGEDAYTVLLKALRGVQATDFDPAKEGRNILQRSGMAYGLSGSIGFSDGTRSSGGKDAVRELHGARSRTLTKGLAADLESRLRGVSRLASGDPKQRAARKAVQNLAIKEQLLRTERRKELLDRLASAQSRREAALRLTAERLHEQGREYEKRVEQLRLQRLAAEWNAKQRSAQMRRALKAELALRDAFMEVLEGEKELLLADRRDARAGASFPLYQTAMRTAENENLDLRRRLEGLIAAERQQRILAERETFLAQRHENQLAATVVRDRMQELLGRIAREEEALLQRRSITTHPESRQQLMVRIRKLLGLS